MIDFHVDNLQFPKNFGKIEKYDRIIEAKSDFCGDMVKFYIKEDNGIISDIGYEVFGCWAVISSCSIMSDYMKGKAISELKKLEEEDIDRICQTDGAPQIKRHCFLLPLKVIKNLK